MKRWTEAELNRLYRYARSLARERSDAYDLVQGGLLRWLELASDDVDEPLSYVMRIIRNLHFDRVRREGRFDSTPLEDHEPVDLDLAPLEQTLVRAEEAEWLLAELNDAERELLYLWAVEGYTIDEISVHVDAPRGTLLSRLHRMRRRLLARRAQRDRGVGS
jgi:RNA polymerase sigma-70 factor (ECF subfamily)